MLVVAPDHCQISPENINLLESPIDVQGVSEASICERALIGDQG